MIYNNALQSTNNFRSDKNVISEVPKKKLTTKESENFSSLRIFHWEFQAVVPMKLNAAANSRLPAGTAVI